MKKFSGCVCTAVFFIFIFQISGAHAQPCDPGTYSSTGNAPCTDCEAGSYNPSPGQSVCMHCDTGSFNPNQGSASPNDCLPCQVGTYNDETGQESCADCPAGTFNNMQGADNVSACVDCDSGFYNASPGQSACMACLEGTYNPVRGSDSAADCLDCEPGSYNPSPGSSVCVDCNAGKFNPNRGSGSEDDCVDCPAGKISAASGAAFCADCEPGKYNPLPGQASCLPCDPGSFSGSPGSSSCQKCPVDTFQTEPGKTACETCPDGTGTLDEANLSCRACLSEFRRLKLTFSRFGDNRYNTLNLKGKAVITKRERKNITPLKNEVSFFIIDTNGRNLFTINIPKGTFNKKSKRGWQALNPGFSWRYRNNSKTPTDGIKNAAIKIDERKRATLSLGLKVTNGSFDIPESLLPLSIKFIAGKNSALCQGASFQRAQCSVNDKSILNCNF